MTARWPEPRVGEPRERYLTRAYNAAYRHWEDWKKETGDVNDAKVELPLQRMLVWLQEHGSCVSLTWDEETRSWECAWITMGKRFVGFAKEPLRAVQIAEHAARQAAVAAGATPPMLPGAAETDEAALWRTELKKVGFMLTGGYHQDAVDNVRQYIEYVLAGGEPVGAQRL